MKKLIAALLLLATSAWARPLPVLRLTVPLLGDIVRSTPPQSGGGGGGGGLANPVTTRTTFGSAQDAANSIDFVETAGRITFEGATADAFEGRLGWTDPTVGDQVILFPDLGAAATDTVMTLGSTQTVTAVKTFSNVVSITTGLALDLQGSTYARWGGDSFMIFNNVKTPDALSLQFGSTSNSLHINESADGGYDFQNANCGTSACTDPELIIHSHNQATAEYVAFWHDGSKGELRSGTGGLNTTGDLAIQNSSGGGLWIGGTAGSSVAALTMNGSANTNPGLGIYVPGTNNYAMIAEVADRAFNFAHATQTDPALFIHSHNQSTTEWVGLTHNGAMGSISTGIGPVALKSGAAVASATALPLPTGNVFHVTGTTTVTSITATSFVAGVTITLIFDGILIFTDGNNLVLGGNFVTTADDTITLAFDGTNFYEVARSIN